MATQDVAITILSQLGGSRAMYMIGAKHIASSNESCGALLFKHTPSKVDGKRVNHCKILLTPDDLYEIHFARTSTKDYVVQKVVSGVPAECLRDVFSTETGLALKLQ